MFVAVTLQCLRIKMPYEVALRRAAGKGDCVCVQLLLESGADVNSTGTHGTTALHFASLNGHYACIQLLLQSGADVNDICDNGVTPLICAVQRDHDMCSRAPWETRADVKTTDDPKEQAVVERAACVGALLKSGAVVNMALANGMTALIRATIMKCDGCALRCC